MDITNTTRSKMLRANFYISEGHDRILESAARIKGKGKSDILRDALELYAKEYNADLEEFIQGFADGFQKERKSITFVEMVTKYYKSLNLEITPEQIILLDKIETYGYLAIKKPRRIGASSILLLSALYKASTAKSNIVFAIGTGNRQDIIAIARKMINMFKNSLPYLVGTVTRDASTLVLGNESTIRVVSLAHVESTIRSQSNVIVYVDEYLSSLPTDAIQACVEAGTITGLYIASNPYPQFEPMWTYAIKPESKIRGVSITWDTIPGTDDIWKQKMMVSCPSGDFDFEYGGKFRQPSVVYDIIGNAKNEGYHIMPGFNTEGK